MFIHVYITRCSAISNGFILPWRHGPAPSTHRHASTRWDAAGRDVLYFMNTQPYNMRGQRARRKHPEQVFIQRSAARTRTASLSVRCRKTPGFVDRRRAQTPCRGTPAPRRSPPPGTGRAAGRNQSPAVSSGFITALLGQLAALRLWHRGMPLHTQHHDPSTALRRLSRLRNIGYS